MKPTSRAQWLGVDQTGAVLSGREGATRARPLFCAHLGLTSGKWTMRASWHGKPLRLARFQLLEIRKLLLEIGGIHDSLGDHSLGIAVDCVFGLPHTLSWWEDPQQSSELTLRSAFLQTLKTPPPHFGRQVAAEFFQRILTAPAQHLRTSPPLPPPMRICEQIAQSNSVFQTTPYQKNIQTGTYRIWRDLAEEGNLRQWQLWPHDFLPGPVSPRSDSLDTALLLEGYPSWYWRNFFGQSCRKPEKLGEILRQRKIRWASPECEKLATSHPDLADAVILALAGLHLQSPLPLQDNPLLSIPNPFTRSQIQALRREGWIAGVPLLAF